MKEITNLETKRKQIALITELKELYHDIPDTELSCKTVLQNITDGKTIDAAAVAWRTFREDPFEVFYTMHRYFSGELSIVKHLHISQQVYIKDFMINGEEGKEIDTNFSAKIETCFLFELK